MNDYDDLFDKKDEIKQEVIYTKVHNEDPYADDIYQRSRNEKRNALLLVAYILISLFVSFGGGLYQSSEYGYLENAIINIEETQDLTFTVADNINPETSEIDEVYPYLVTISGQYKSNFEHNIPIFRVEAELYDISEAKIGIASYSEENFDQGDIFTINESFESSVEPVNMTATMRVEPPTLFFTIFQLTHVTIMAVVFIIIDKMAFKKDWIDFKKNRKLYTQNIVAGFLIVYASLIASNIILTLLGVTDTSENEMTIRMMFNDSPLNLFLLFLTLTILTPIAEELIFRKVIFNFIEPRTNYKVAIVLTGVIFGLMHVINFGDFIQAIPYVLMGISFGYVYWKSNKNIYVVITVHFLNNFLSWLLYVLTIYGLSI